MTVHFSLFILVILSACTPPSAPKPTFSAPAQPHPVTPNEPTTRRLHPVVHPAVRAAGKLLVPRDTPIPEGLELHPLAPGSFDDTAVGPAPPLARAQRITFVGPDGTCVVETADRMAIANGRRGVLALAVPEGACPAMPFVVAVDGAGSGRTIRPGEQVQSEEAATWAERVLATTIWQPRLHVGAFEHASYVEPTGVPNTDVLYVFTNVPTAHRVATQELLVRRGRSLLARRTEASFVTTLRWEGRTYVVVEPGARATRLRPLEAIDITP